MLTTKKSIIVWGCLALVGAVFSSPIYAGETLTLMDCINHGLKHNPTVRGSAIRIEEAEDDIKTARADFLPSLTASYSLTNVGSIQSKGPTETDYLDQINTYYSVGLSQILYAGSGIYTNYKKAQADRDMKIATREMVELDLIYKIKTAFYQLLKARQDIASITHTVERLESGLTSAKAYFDQKMIPYVQVLQAELDLSGAQQSLSKTKNTVARVRSQLVSLLNLPHDEKYKFLDNLQPSDTHVPESFDLAWQEAQKNRPDLRMLSFQKTIAQKEVIIAKSRYYPQVRMTANYYDSDRDYDKLGVYTNGETYDRDQVNRYWTAGVTVSWNFFDGGRNYYKKNKFLKEIKWVDSKIDETVNSIKSRIQISFLALKEAESRIDFSNRAVKAATEYYNREKKRLKARLTTMPAVLEAQAQLARAESNYNQVLLDYSLALADLNYSTGYREL